MAIPAGRRGRSSRTMTVRLGNGPVNTFLASLRERRSQFRYVLCGVALVVLTISVQGWRLPFPFRQDQQTLHGVAAKIQFDKVNLELTRRAQERAADDVLPIYRNDPQPLTRLPEELRTGLLQIGQATSLQQLSPEIRGMFGLSAGADAAAGGAVPAPDRNEAFQALKLIAGNEHTLKDVMAEFSEFIQPIQDRGIIRPENLPADLRVRDNVTVTTPPNRSETVSTTEIQMPQLLAPTGLLHARWEKFPNLLPRRFELGKWLLVRTPETLRFDEIATQAAREQARQSVPEVKETFNKGDVLVAPGERMTVPKLELLRAEYAATEEKVDWTQRVIRVATVLLLFLVLAVLNGYYLVRNEPRLVANFGRLSIYLSVLVGTVALSRVLSFDPWRAEVAPILATVMVFAIAYNQVLAIMTAFSLALITTLSTGGDVSQFVMLMGVSATAIILLPGVSSRSTVVIVGACTAAAWVLLYWGTAVIEEQTSANLWTDSNEWFQCLRGAGWCLAAGFLVSGSLPFIESALGVVTDISLLELGDVSHPLLQELVRRAPGTYNHSITVASIAETAADAIGANGLLVRVGAYFHDIGKMLKPQYFVENVTSGEASRHQHLAPAMSTLIIIGHVKDGADLARQHSLPAALIDFIEQHHGTTLVAFFYHEAARQADLHPDHRTDAEESSFRYPGPKPQSKEAAVLMVADAVEGASRTLSEPTPKRIERLVHDIAMQRLLDGQFEDCGLTFTELVAVEESLTKSLTAIYHGRVKYPEQRTA